MKQTIQPSANSQSPHSCPLKDPASSKTSRRVFVVGGGIAGLTAAEHLALHGYRVTLFEARDRLGGRIHTLWQNGTPIELGASYWEGFDCNPFYQKFFQNSRERFLQPFLLKNWTGAPSQKPTIVRTRLEQSIIRSTDPSKPTISPKQLKKLHVVASQFETWREHYYTPRQLKQFKNLKELIDHLTPRLIHDGKLSPNEEQSFKKFFYTLYAEQSTDPTLYASNPEYPAPEDQSKLERECEPFNPDTAYTTFVRGGFSKVIDQLEKSCREKGVKIKLNTPITKISSENDRVWVTAQNGERFEGAKLICTLPEGVMKAQAGQLFDPPLPPQKLEAIQTMQIHQSCRIVLEFECPFWNNLQSPYLFLDDPSKEKYMEFVLTTPVNGKAMLSTLSYAKEAQEIYASIDPSDPKQVEKATADLVQRVISDLRKAYPKLPELSNFIVHNWSDDPYTLGGYYFESPGMTLAKKHLLGMPCEPIYFAGAYTSRIGESVPNGATAGVRAALEVEAALETEARADATAKQRAETQTAKKGQPMALRFSKSKESQITLIEEPCSTPNGRKFTAAL